ncbi:MAG: hypothetical protein WAN71_04020 [Mycobacterium sp.]|uniref:hypothetical protein n=1 Tax=Mycobacterium sp. TaxID=1785 RepID=UPI003BB0A98B
MFVGTYRAEIDGRCFEFALAEGHLAAAHGKPDVTVTASAADLATARLGSTEAKRKAALRIIAFDGEADAVDALRRHFRCRGFMEPDEHLEPGLGASH